MFLCVLVQVRLGTEILHPRVRPDQGSNSWLPDHDSSFHVTETPAVTTQPKVTSALHHYIMVVCMKIQFMHWQKICLLAWVFLFHGWALFAQYLEQWDVLTQKQLFITLQLMPTARSHLHMELSSFGLKQYLLSKMMKLYGNHFGKGLNIPFLLCPILC